MNSRSVACGRSQCEMSRASSVSKHASVKAQLRTGRPGRELVADRAEFDAVVVVVEQHGASLSEGGGVAPPR
jgi:hypothetical protein